MSMKAIQRCAFVLACLVMLLPASAWAQGGAGSGIAGVVRDTSGGVLPGVTVEAASPVLIEKLRTAVTDGQGLYQFVDLRPGTYTVTFSLTGFNRVVRNGVELETGFTATVNADLAVGSLDETITVTGEASLVDTRSVMERTSLSDKTLDALPTTRRLGSFADFLPAARGTADVGGLNGENGATFSVHGGRGNEINVNQDGLNVTMLASAAFSWNPAAVQEVVVEASGTSAETFSGGVRVNMVPKEGANTFSGGFNGNFTSPDFQSENLSDELVARHLLATPSVRRSYQVGADFGGPVKKDRLWFFTAHRKWVVSSYVPGTFYNKLNGTLFYEADRSRPGYTTNFYTDHTLRLTWQATQKDKLSVSFSGQNNCNCPISLTGTTAPEATGNAYYTPNYAAVASWTHPITSRLLVEAGSSMNMAALSYTRRPEGTLLSSISVTDSTLGITYGSRAGSVATGIGNPCCYGTMSINKQYNERVAVSYITGTHAFKTGLTYQWYTFRNHNEEAIDIIHGARAYTFANGVPRSVRIFATPFGRASDSTTIGAYAQDQWTIKKFTLNLGLRYDTFNATAVAQSFSAGYFVGARSFPEVKDVPSWKNLNPRLGIAYDVFGNGRTAIKGSWGRYVLGTSSTGNNNVALNQPIENQANQADRTWNDTNGNYVPDCVLGPEVPGANGECGALSDLAFGQLRTANANQRYADDALTGFNSAQNYLWRGSISLDHEIRPGLGVNVGYFRTWYGNFQVTDNTLVTPADYDEYCITAPVDSRLPGGGGNRICGLYDLKPEKFGQVFNLVTLSKNYGKQTDIFNGIDVNLNARFRGNVIVRGGVATGNQVTDNCYVIDSPQQQYQCHVAPSWGSQTQVKFQAIYPLPWDLRASVIYQNLPGIATQASYVATNAEIAPSLGRNLGSCRGSATCNGQVTVNLIQPNTVFEPRRNEIDLRFAKTVRVRRVSIEGDLDIYNLLNTNNVLQIQTRYGAAWLDALQIIPGRLVKIGLQVNF